MTMMVFSRRALQERLGVLESVLAPHAHQQLIGRLERRRRDRLSAMWETVFLAALNGVTPLRYEAPLADGSKPDFALIYGHGGTSFVIVGDITTASDKGLHASNPVKHFWDEIVRLARKYRLNPNHFRFDVRGRDEGEYGDSRVRLLLPPRSQFAAFMKQRIEPFIRDLAGHPKPQASFPYSAPGVEFTLTYDQAQVFAAGGHASYNIAYSLTKTPVYTALEKKADQLRHAPLQALRVVLLCDAGCGAMRSSPGSSSGSYSASQIATAFLRTTNAVDMVLLVTVEETNPYGRSDRHLRLRADLAVTPQDARDPRLTREAIDAVRALLDATLKALPTPMLDAQNAALRCDAQDYGWGFHGRYSMCGKSIRISSRQVLELLAGAISTTEFRRRHGWDEESASHGPPNPFVNALARGEMIHEITVIDGGDHDDDWLEIRLREPDPAISPFRRTR